MKRRPPFIWFERPPVRETIWDMMRNPRCYQNKYPKPLLTRLRQHFINLYRKPYFKLLNWLCLWEFESSFMNWIRRWLADHSPDTPFIESQFYDWR